MTGLVLIEVLLDYPQLQGFALFLPLYLWLYSGLNSPHGCYGGATDENETYSEMFLVYHLDSNILAQLCD